MSVFFKNYFFFDYCDCKIYDFMIKYLSNKDIIWIKKHYLKQNILILRLI